MRIFQSQTQQIGNGGCEEGLGLAANILTPACPTFVMGCLALLGQCHIARLLRDYVAKRVKGLAVQLMPGYDPNYLIRGLTRRLRGGRLIDVGYHHWAFLWNFWGLGHSTSRFFTSVRYYCQSSSKQLGSLAQIMPWLQYCSSEGAREGRMDAGSGSRSSTVAAQVIEGCARMCEMRCRLDGTLCIMGARSERWEVFPRLAPADQGTT